MTKAVELAKHLIWMASKEEKPEFLTPLRLQNLLYYIQGWSLALRGNPFFAEPIEAWKYGPVIKSVYEEFRQFGDQPIPVEEGKEGADLSRKDRGFIDSIWETYKEYAAIGIIKKTHSETPWLAARAGCSPDENAGTEISQAAMTEFFSAEYVRKAVHGFTLEETRRMLQSESKNSGTPLADVLARFGLSHVIEGSLPEPSRR